MSLCFKAWSLCGKVCVRFLVEHLVFLFDLLQGGVMEEHEDVRRNIAENVSCDICDQK